MIRPILLVVNLLVVLVGVGLAVAHKERTLRDGTRVLLPLAPVDPRKSRAHSKSISTTSSIKTPWSTAPSLPNGVVVNSPRF